MPSVKVGSRHRITIPSEVFKKLNLVAGDVLEMTLKGENIVLTPARIIPRDQVWFWTEEWQKRIKEAEEDVMEDRLSGPFENADGLLNHLRSQDENPI